MKHRSPRGFTLVELLLAMAILAVVLAMFAAAVGAVSRTWLQGVSRIETFTKARVILSLLDRDIQSLVMRRDLAAFVDDAGSNSFAFYTQVNGLQGNRQLSLVRYAITNTGTNSMLQRWDYGMAYTNSTLPLSNVTSLPVSTASPQDVTDGLLRFDWQFVTGNGTFKPAYHFDYYNPDSPDNTRLLIVSIIALDDRAFQLAVQTGKRTQLQDKLAGIPAAGQTYGDYWNSKISSPSFGQDLPETVSGGVRVFERRYSLNQP